MCYAAVNLLIKILEKCTLTINILSTSAFNSDYATEKHMENYKWFVINDKPQRFNFNPTITRNSHMCTMLTALVLNIIISGDIRIIKPCGGPCILAKRHTLCQVADKSDAAYCSVIK